MLEKENNMIRSARPEDANAIVNLVMEFKDESLHEYSMSFRTKTIFKIVKNLINDGVCSVIDDNGNISGVVIGLVFPSIFDEHILIAQEMIWYVSEKFRHGIGGIRLLKFFENECKKKGVRQIIMVHMGNSKAEKLELFYKKIGYKELERHYIKEV
jgi:N-acetylglutamate synthase-like GNAT family acetyltransferase